MPRQVFTAGEILTAANMNDLADATVMVFDDSSARGSAIPTPAEGMLTFLKDTDALESYDGAAFVPAVNSASIGSAAITQSLLETPLNASGSAPLFATRAWANLDCSSSPSVRASGNVSSITRQSQGNFTVSFTTSMADANYAISVSARDVSDGSGDGTSVIRGGTTPGTGSFQISTGGVRGITATQDLTFVYITVSR